MCAACVAGGETRSRGRLTTSSVPFSHPILDLSRYDLSKRPFLIWAHTGRARPRVYNHRSPPRLTYAPLTPVHRAPRVSLSLLHLTAKRFPGHKKVPSSMPHPLSHVLLCCPSFRLRVMRGGGIVVGGSSFLSASVLNRRTAFTHSSASTVSSCCSPGRSGRLNWRNGNGDK